MSVSVTKFKYSRILYISALIIGFLIRVTWGFTRDIFQSGPDAPTYIQMAKDLAQNGFFSPDLTGVPYFTQGYATLISLFYYVFEENFIFPFQVFQVLIFISSIELYRKVSLRVLNENFSYFFGIALVLQPASFFFPLMCMYETLFFFFLAIFAYSIFGSPSNTFLFSLSAAALLVIHQRSLPIVLIGLFLVRDKISSKFLISLFVFMTIPILFILRNGIIYDSWRLATAGDLVITGLNEKGGERLIAFFQNIVFFWSSYSGPLKRGTWFHNLNVWKIFDLDWANVSLLLISLVLQIIIFSFFVYLLFTLFKTIRPLSLFITFSMGSAILIDGLVYGDSRHRLVYSAFTVLSFVFFLNHSRTFESLRKKLYM